MPKPEERRLRELGEAIVGTLRSIQLELHSLAALLKPFEQSTPTVNPDNVPTHTEGAPKPQATIQAITQWTDTQREEQNVDRQRNNAFQRKSLWVQWFLFGATFLAFVAAGYYAHVASSQENVMVGQLSTMTKQWEAMKRQDGIMDRTLVEIRKQTGFAKQTAEATSSQAKISDRSARAAEYALHVTEAADIEFDHIECDPPLHQALTLDTKIAIIYKNTGKTSAGNVTAEMHIGFRKTEDSQINNHTLREATPPTPSSVTSLGAGLPMRSGPTRIGDLPSLKHRLDDVNSGTLKFYVWGTVTYSDRFGSTHASDIVTLYEPHNHSFTVVTVGSH